MHAEPAMLSQKVSQYNYTVVSFNHYRVLCVFFFGTYFTQISNPSLYRLGHFLQEIYEAFVKEAIVTGKPRLLLTAAVAAGKDTIDYAYEVDKIAR